MTSWLNSFRLKKGIDGKIGKFRETDSLGQTTHNKLSTVAGSALKTAMIRHAKTKTKEAGKASPPKHGGYGIDVKAKGNYWMASAIGRLQSAKKTAPAPESDNTPAALSNPDDVQDDLLKIINDNPKISAATFLNMIQGQGFTITKGAVETGAKVPGKKTKEADTAGANTQNLRAGVNTTDPHKHKESEGTLSFQSCKFKEAAGGAGKSNPGDGSRFSATLLMEGMGNLVDGFYYTKEALLSGVPLFEGKKIYADHPSEFDEEVRPERSVRDILGHFENCQVETMEDGRQALTADVVILPGAEYDWARTQMSHAIKYSEKFPDKEFIGLSINASGDSAEVPLDQFMSETQIPESCIPKLMKAKEQGVEDLKLAMKFKNAVSIDLVTTPGAGGKILQFLEQEKTAMANTSKTDKKKKLEEARKAKEVAAAAMKEAEKAEKEAKKEAGEAGDGADGGHDDGDADKKMIKAAIKKHLGDDSDGSDEEEAQYQAAMESYKEMGYESEAACDAAGHAMKLVKHEAKKSKEAGAAPGTDDADGGAGGAPAGKKESETVENHKESEKVVKLQGRIASLEEKLTAREVEDHIEDTLVNSGLPRQVTKTFRESIKGTKSTKEVDNKFKLFMEAYRAAGGEARVPNLEKTGGEVGSDSKVGFGDCLTD